MSSSMEQLERFLKISEELVEQLTSENKALKAALAQPAPVPLKLWTETQHERAYRNSPELHKDVKSLAAFKRVAKEVAAMYGITEKGQP